MNGEALLFVSNLTSAVAYGSWSLFKWYKRRQHRNEVFCIVSARHGGISTAVKRLRDDNREYNRAILLDEDDVIEKQPHEVQQHLHDLRNTNQDSYMVEVYPLIRKHIQELRIVHGNNPVVLFTSLVKLPKFLGVKDKRCLMLYTSGDFHKELVEGLPHDNHSQEDVKRMADTRDNLLSQPYERMKYTSFGHLKRILEHMLLGRPHL